MTNNLRFTISISRELDDLIKAYALANNLKVATAGRVLLEKALDKK
jgi:hypothetical protein